MIIHPCFSKGFSSVKLETKLGVNIINKMTGLLRINTVCTIKFLVGYLNRNSNGEEYLYKKMSNLINTAQFFAFRIRSQV